MLYQYLLDEVARKQPKVVIKKRTAGVEDAHKNKTIITLEVMDDDLAHNGDLLDTAAGFSDRRSQAGVFRSTHRRPSTFGLGAIGEPVIIDEEEGRDMVLARSRSEKRPSRSRGLMGDGSTEPMPRLPAFAATKIARDEVKRREVNRLTM